MSIPDIISAGKDVVLAIAGSLGAYVAFQGLNTWKRQLKGAFEYELARRLLKNTYRLRQAIAVVRNPFMSAQEMHDASQDSGGLSAEYEQRKRQAVGLAYEERWKKIAVAYNDLETDLLEAEAVWGIAVKNAFQPLYQSLMDLRRVMWLHIWSISSHESLVTVEAPKAEEQAARMRVLYDTSEGFDKPDEFAAQVKRAIDDIEAILKPHLRR